MDIRVLAQTIKSGLSQPLFMSAEMLFETDRALEIYMAAEKRMEEKYRGGKAVCVCRGLLCKENQRESIHSYLRHTKKGIVFKLSTHVKCLLKKKGV